MRGMREGRGGGGDRKAGEGEREGRKERRRRGG